MITHHAVLRQSLRRRSAAPRSSIHRALEASDSARYRTKRASGTLTAMAVSAKRAKELALSLENASSYPHFDRVAFRTPRRTFATLASSGGDLNLMLDVEQQKQFCSMAPQAMAPVAGGWGRMGWTACDLSTIDAATFKAALLAAHARANLPPAKRARKKIARPRNR